MPVSINGTTGITNPDGSASAPSIVGSDSNTGVFFPAADTVGIATNGIERVRVASDGSQSSVVTSGSTLYPAFFARAWVNFNGSANSNISGTYSQSGTAITVTATNHGLSAGQSVYLTFSTGTATAELCTVASVTSTSVFVATSATSRTTSGNCTLNFQTIRASGNVSSVTDNGTGDYTVNFTTAMPDANYAVVSSVNNTTGSTTTSNSRSLSAISLAVGSVRVINQIGTGNAADQDLCNVVVFR